jgi:hypothetical protein
MLKTYGIACGNQKITNNRPVNSALEIIAKQLLLKQVVTYVF